MALLLAVLFMLNLGPAYAQDDIWGFDDLPAETGWEWWNDDAKVLGPSTGEDNIVTEPTEPEGEVPLPDEGAAPTNDVPITTSGAGTSNQFTIHFGGGNGVRTRSTEEPLNISWFPEYGYDFNIAPGWPIHGDWSVYSISDMIVYCIEPLNLNSTEGKIYETSQNWTKLSEEQKRQISHILIYGAQNAYNLPYHCATQALVWEVTLGYRDDNFNRTANYVYSGFVSGTDIESYYNTLVSQVSEHLTIPSFASATKNGAPTYKLTGDDGSFLYELTDSRGMVGNMHYLEMDGITFEKVGDQLVIYADHEINPAELVTCVKDGTEDGGGGSLVFWITGGPNFDQAKAHYEGSPDPVTGYFYITTDEVPPPGPEPDNEFEITIIKRAEGTGALLPGATFEVRHTSHGVFGTVTTGPDGKAKVKVPWAGTYILTETAAPDGFIKAPDPDAELYLDVDNPKAERTFYNAPHTGIKVTKVDASTGQTLAGAVIQITEISAGIPYSMTTGSDGVAHFTGLRPGSYAVTEITSPTGYILNNRVYPVELESNKLATVTIPNERKGGLYIRKVDSEGAPIAGAVFEIRRGSGEVIMREITDVNGLIYRGNLSTDTYVVEEIQAPTGYILDPNNPQSVYINTADSNKEYILTFVNKKLPSIEIKKVDADNPNLPLMGATFIIREQGGSKSWDITTDSKGVARKDNLEHGTTYIVEEIIPPAGYELGGYKEAIVLKPGETHTITVTNKATPGLVITKEDRASNKKLPGAKVKIEYADGRLLGTYVTDDEGRITLADIAPGVYKLTEIESPQGYVLDSTSHTIVVEAGTTAYFTLYNDARPGLLLEKSNSANGKPVVGVRFHFARLENGAKTDIGEYTTDANGLIFLAGLMPGQYIVTETYAPDGYVIDPTPHYVFMEGGKLNTLKLYNDPLSKLVIRKVDPDRYPLSGAVFRLYDSRRLEIGTYQTDALGLVEVPQLTPGVYYLQEIKAPTGYQLDTTVRKIDVVGGSEQVTVEVVNKALGNLRIIKTSPDGTRLYGATFLLYDADFNVLGEYTTNQNGVIAVEQELKPGTYYVKEFRAPDGFVLDNKTYTVVVRAGQSSELIVKNYPQVGKVQVVKIAAANNSITGDKKGDTLRGATFKIYDENMNVVDTITTNRQGIGTSIELPLGSYLLKEIKAPRYYLTDGKPIAFEIKKTGDLVRFVVENRPEDISVTVEKRGPTEAKPGNTITYDFREIANTSNTNLDEFYWHDVLPVEAVRLQSIHTGTWSERLTYTVYYKTNLKSGTWKVLKRGLSTQTSHELDCTPAALRLAENEHITEFKFDFGAVREGFREKTAPSITCEVLKPLSDGYRFTNKTDVGGRIRNEWTYARDTWTTIFEGPKRPLPKTGY